LAVAVTALIVDNAQAGGGGARSFIPCHPFSMHCGINHNKDRCAFPAFIPFDGVATEHGVPEGVAVDKPGNIYVSVNVAGGGDQIWKFAPSGEKSVLVDFGAPGLACGLAVDAIGNVYAAQPVVPEQIIGGNALAFDQRGTLYVTESFSFDGSGNYALGGIWQIPKGGTATLWLRHELLTGVYPDIMGASYGANGIGFYHGSLYVINTDKALVVRIPVRRDGSPGQPEVWKQIEEVPESITYQNPYLPLVPDGLALDAHGNVYIAVPTRGAIVRINADDRSQETVAVYPDASLDAPYSLAFGTGKGERESLFITNAGISGQFIPGVPWPGPGLVKIDAGMPGLPLP
jgi:sugar lactone lactonase YvrE